MPEDTLNIECLMQAINEYADAKSERDKARDEYDGYSWGYHGSHFEDSVAKKAAEVKNQLRATVREMIREELSTKVR